MVETFAEWLSARIADWLAREGGDVRGKIDRFAKRVGVGPSTVSQWIRGAARPNEYGCILLANALGMPIEEVRRIAGRTAGVAEAHETYGDNSDVVLEELRLVLGPNYEFMASLDPEARRAVLRTLAGVLHPYLQLHQRIRQLEQRPTS